MPPLQIKEGEMHPINSTHLLCEYRDLAGKSDRSIGLWFLGHTPWIGEQTVCWYLHCGELKMLSRGRLVEEVDSLHLKLALSPVFKHGEEIVAVEKFDEGVLISIEMSRRINTLARLLRSRARNLASILRGPVESLVSFLAKGVDRPIPEGWLFYPNGPMLYMLGTRESRGGCEVLYYIHAGGHQLRYLRMALPDVFSDEYQTWLGDPTELKQGLLLRVEMAEPIRDPRRLVVSRARTLSMIAESIELDETFPTEDYYASLSKEEATRLVWDQLGL